MNSFTVRHACLKHIGGTFVRKIGSENGSARPSTTLISRSLTLGSPSLRKAIDKSRVPELHEEDLEEKFIKGWGPGGQSVNKTNSACFLRHIPSGLIVKCQDQRSLEQNRKQARLSLQMKLDDLINKENSVSAQKQRIEGDKSKRREKKSEKRQQLKEQWQKEDD